MIIDSVASYIPREVVTNKNLENKLDTNDKWIFDRTGIKQRHISNYDETTTVLAINAAKLLLKRESIDPNDINAVIVTTMSQDYFTPSTACIVQGEIGCDNAFAFDINAACSGYVYGLSIASALLKEKRINNILLISSEVMSKLLDWTDRSTCVLFGDGASATLLKSTNYSNELFKLKSYGRYNDALMAKIIQNHSADFSSYLGMSGRSIYNFSTKIIPKEIMEICSNNYIDLDDIDWFILHQANYRLTEAIARNLNVNIEKFPTNIDKNANTSSSSIPILLDEMISNNRLKRGQKVLLCGFGGGLTVGSMILKF